MSCFEKIMTAEVSIFFGRHCDARGCIVASCEESNERALDP